MSRFGSTVTTRAKAITVVVTVKVGDPVLDFNIPKIRDRFESPTFQNLRHSDKFRDRLG